MKGISKRIIYELEHHIPFTIFGASTGVALIAIIVYGDFFSEISSVAENIFFILHPTHIFLSAVTTTTIYLKYSKKKRTLHHFCGGFFYLNNRLFFITRDFVSNK